MEKQFESRSEQYANIFDLKLDRLAREAYAKREEDVRWGLACQKIDAARREVRAMMHPKRVEATRY